MSHRYSSSTNASRVAEGISSRPGIVHQPTISESAEAAQAPRTFFGTFSVHSGKTGRIARRLSSRISEPSTFYREATPPGSSHGEPEARPQETYDGRYDYVAPPAPLHVAPITICGVSRRKFCLFLSALIVAVVIAVAVPVGVIFGLRNNRHTADKSTGATRYGVPASNKFVIILTVLCSINLPTPSTTGTSSSISTATSTAPSAASTSLLPCPAANNTQYRVPNTEKTFKRLCGVDYSGVDQARDLGSVWTTTMQDCIFQCADFTGCTACGWGIIADDPGSEHRCWLKSGLKSSHSARAGWDFAILEQ